MTVRLSRVEDCEGRATSLWFSYYKDLRSSGGRLKLGYGPGGPPVLGMRQVGQLMQTLAEIGCSLHHNDETSSERDSDHWWATRQPA